MIRKLWKPWFVWRPSQVGRRLIRALRKPASGFQPLETAWGGSILADPSKNIGYSIWTTGIYDLAVSEVMARLVNPGNTVIDAGANIGYMTVLGGTLAGSTGRVISFEPHPDLFPILQKNAANAATRTSFAKAELHQAALGSQKGTAELVLPDEMADNDGIARIAQGDAGSGKTISVPVQTIDDVLGGDGAALLKIDVEGYELPVLKGARRALEERRITHILFEDHVGKDSPVVQYLRDVGCRLYSIGWSINRPLLEPIEGGKRSTDYEAPNYLATFAEDEAIAQCRPRGWNVLRTSLTRRSYSKST